jgi:hypothetical protein
VAGIGTEDRRVVGDLAKRCEDIALGDECERRRKRWRDVNERRKPDRAPVWCRPAGVWRELLPPEALECQDPLARGVEYVCRQHLYKDWVGDDHILEPWWGVPGVFRCDTAHVWGLPTGVSVGTTDQGGFRYDPPVKTPEDYERITVPSFSPDPAATQEAAGRMADLLGEAMPVRVTGTPPLGPILGTYLEQLRGMAPLMEDLAFRPALVHRAMAKLTEGVLGALRVAEASGTLTTNHHEPMFCSDSVNGAAAEGEVRLANLWTAANSQEFDQVSPGMMDEFLLSYQIPVFQQFGAVQYGCCENLTTKTAGVLRIPNLRVFVCSAWTDLDRVLDACGTRYTIMWRQSAAQVTLSPDLASVRAHLAEGMRKLQGHAYQVVLREVETLQGRPERIREWARTAIEEAERHG